MIFDMSQPEMILALGLLILWQPFGSAGAVTVIGDSRVPDIRVGSVTFNLPGNQTSVGDGW